MRHVTLPPKASAISQACDLLNELNHLLLLDGTRSVLVKLGEALVEVSVAEAGAVSHVLKSVHNELLGLVLVELSRVVLVILGPDFVDALRDYYVDFRHLRLSFFLCCHFFLYLFFKYNIHNRNSLTKNSFIG